MKNIGIITAIASIAILSSIWGVNRINKKDKMGSDDRVSFEIRKSTSKYPDNPNEGIVYEESKLKDIYLAGGCFWGVEAYMERVYGVADVTSGYANGSTEMPSYEDVIYKKTGHAETVHVKYDPDRVSLEKLLEQYFNIIDPTILNKQGNDRGTQYRTGIYYTSDEDKNIIDMVIEKEQEKYRDEIVTEIEMVDNYYLAEDYHQDYLKKNPNGYCHIDFSSLEEQDIKEDMDNEDMMGKDDLGLDKYVRPSDDEIYEKLSDLAYRVTQKNATERAFTHEYNNNKEVGIYVDVVSGEPLFSSKDKYDSGSGWPSFTKPIVDDVIEYKGDKGLFVARTEIRSKRGDSHLGHVFDDGPKDKGGKRYCTNGAALKFIQLDDMKKSGYESFIKYVK